MKTRWTVLAALLWASTATMAQAQSPKQPLEQWQTYATNPQIKMSDLGEHQAMAVFYRLNDVSDAPANVYINGHYQASLLPNTFSARAVCANKQTFGVALSRTDRFDDVNQGVYETLPVGDVAFFRVLQNAAGQVGLVRVPADVAKAELVNTQAVAQTVSRTPEAYALQCSAPVLQTMRLSANALFGFNQFAYEKIEPSAYRELAEISRKIQELGNERIQKIVVAGYTDPEGSDEYNRDLSQKRAAVIQAALREKGGVTAPMEAVGLGETELRVSDCAAKHVKDMKARQACNQPNRRVEITVIGQQ